MLWNIEDFSRLLKSLSEVAKWMVSWPEFELISVAASAAFYDSSPLIFL